MNAKIMTLCEFHWILEIYSRMVLILMLQSLLWVSTKQLDCEEIRCSHVFDPLCGIAVSTEGIHVLAKLHNICYFNKMKCRLRHLTVDIYQVDADLCNMRAKPEPFNLNGRRLNNLGITGSYQACNHSCPTFCTDVYAPVCAEIMHSASYSTHKPMVNHCHVDLFSCTSGLNVTITSLPNCFKNYMALLFATHAATLNSLKLIDDTPPKKIKKQAAMNNTRKPARRSHHDYGVEEQINHIMNKLLQLKRNDDVKK